MLCLRLFAFWFFLMSLVTAGLARGQMKQSLTLQSGRKVAFEEFGNLSSASCLIVLHGASGPSRYRDQARFFGTSGFHVVMPHYFDVTRSSWPSTENYRSWASLTADFVSECRKQPATKKVFVVGFSLGSSVALAAGSQNLHVDGIAEWYGSLPDEFFYQMKGMPPLLILHGELDSSIPILNAEQLVKFCDMKQLRCEHHFYSDQRHGFTGKALQDANRRTLSFFAQFHPKGGGF
jgi:carboxymethylenebutenolidase